MPSRRSQLPVGSQFGPDLINLDEALKLFIRRSGDREKLVAELFQHPIHLKRNKPPDSDRGAKLPFDAAVKYGLLTPRTWEVTPFANELAALSPDDQIETLARHIVLNLGGLRLIEAAEQMKADGLRITGDTIAEYLTAQGFFVPVHNTGINSLRMWLAAAGVFPMNDRRRAWDVSPEAKKRLVGLGDDQIALLTGLDEGQVAFVKALCSIDPDDWYPAAAVRDLAEAQSGIRLARSSLPSQYLQPLADAGLIDYDPGGTRQGKTSRLKTTSKFKSEIVEPFVTTTVKALDAVLTEYYKLRPEDIYAAMMSTDKAEKGKGMEAYAIYIMRLLGLRFVGWRKRAKATTGRGEVDAVLAGVLGAVPTRWKVQCKNTPGSGPFDLEDIAKEVGLTLLTRATHVLAIVNGKITEPARTYAAEINRQTPLAVFLLDRADFETIRSNPGEIGAILRTQSRALLDYRSDEKSDSVLW